jgi:hypothetical protein
VDTHNLPGIVNRGSPRLSLNEGARVKRRKKIKNSLARGHVEDIGSTLSIHSYEGQVYEGVMSRKCIATSRHPHLYVMAVLYGARVVRVL